MHKEKKFLAIIPARGGSKRLPRKNVLDLAGKPLIAWTIDAALYCPFLDEIMVTTDDEEIAETARRYRANVPFLRPAELGSDTATSFDAVKHAIDYYKYYLSMEFDFVVLLQPTSPLRDSDDISKAINFLFDKNADAIVSVCEVEHSPLWVNTLPTDLNMTQFLKTETTSMRSQDLPKHYRLNGAIYICRTERLLFEKSFFISDNIFSYIMEKEASVDIDDQHDFKFASYLISNRTL